MKKLIICKPKFGLPTEAPIALFGKEIENAKVDTKKVFRMLRMSKNGEKENTSASSKKWFY